jgi:hypothetical protein
MHAEHIPPTNTLWTPAQAMAFMRVTSRQTLYKKLAEWDALGLPRPYSNINPAGKYEIRRFYPDLLAQCVRAADEKNHAGQQETPDPVSNQ